MNQVDPRQGGLDLVALEVADHMPLRPASRAGIGVELAGSRTAAEPFVDRGGTFGQLLHTVLAQVGEAQVDHCTNDVQAGVLGDGHEGDTRGTSPGPLACVLDSFLDAFPVLGQLSLHRMSAVIALH